MAYLAYSEKQLMTGFVLDEHNFVDITPAPVFPWLQRLDDWVTCLKEVLGGVLIFRAVTAAHMAADQADAQMKPGIPRSKAFFASAVIGLDIANQMAMGTL